MKRIASALALLVSAAAAAEDPCDRILALANTGRLDAAILRPVPPREDDTERWQQDGERWGYVAGAYVLELGATRERLLAVEQGGSCRSMGLAREDGTELAFGEPWVGVDEGFGLDVVPVLVGADTFAVALWRDAWELTPLAAGRLDTRGLTPLCRFRATGEIRRETDARAGSACTAFVAGDVETLGWADVAHGDEPDAADTIVSSAARADVDWHGTGTPIATWKLAYESGAGCGMTYEWLALDASTEGRARVDTTGAAAQALFPVVAGERMPRGPWRIDAVFAHAGRHWLAAQPHWGHVPIGAYAVQRLDPDGLHVECRYRMLPEFAIETRAE